MPADQLNIEYWFRLAYDCLHGACYSTPSTAGLIAWLSHLWLWIIVIGYVLSVIALIVIIYSTVRLFELRKQEEELYSTVIPEHEEAGGTNARWQHVESLAESATASDWRSAILEADIMLDDLLTNRGYVGEGVGEKLKAVDPANFHTLNDAWEAHKVRNQVAHQGSKFDLSDTVAQRTLARYESVFREFNLI